MGVRIKFIIVLLIFYNFLGILETKKVVKFTERDGQLSLPQIYSPNYYYPPYYQNQFRQLQWPYLHNQFQNYQILFPDGPESNPEIGIEGDIGVGVGGDIEGEIGPGPAPEVPPEFPIIDGGGIIGPHPGEIDGGGGIDIITGPSGGGGGGDHGGHYPEYGVPGQGPGKPIDLDNPEVCTIGYALASIFGLKALKDVTITAKTLSPFLKGLKKSTALFPILLLSKLILAPLKPIAKPLKFFGGALVVIIALPLLIILAPVWLPIAAFIGIKYIKSELISKVKDKKSKKKKKPKKKNKFNLKGKVKDHFKGDSRYFENYDYIDEDQENSSIQKLIESLDDTCIERISCELERATNQMFYYEQTFRQRDLCDQFSCKNLLQLLKS